VESAWSEPRSVAVLRDASARGLVYMADLIIIRFAIFVAANLWVIILLLLSFKRHKKRLLESFGVLGYSNG